MLFESRKNEQFLSKKLFTPVATVDIIKRLIIGGPGASW
jgi:hypothetical protein